MIYGFGLLDSGFHVSIPGYMGGFIGNHSIDQYRIESEV
jgi:hypothetical protein